LLSWYNNPCGDDFTYYFITWKRLGAFAKFSYQVLGHRAQSTSENPRSSSEEDLGKNIPHAWACLRYLRTLQTTLKWTWVWVSRNWRRCWTIKAIIECVVVRYNKHDQLIFYMVDYLEKKRPTILVDLDGRIKWCIDKFTVQMFTNR